LGSAAILSARYWCVFAVVPIVGAIRGACRFERQFSAAVMGGAVWGGIQGGIGAVAFLTLGLVKSAALFYALVFLEMNLILGAGVGFLVGVGFKITRTRAVQPIASNDIS